MLTRDRIVIGASAGGIAALQTVVAGFPADLRAAVFITLHLFERSRMILPELLSEAGPLPAALAMEGEPIREGRIYIAPPDHHLQFTSDTIQFGHGPREGLQRPSINVMFRSAAANFGDRVAGVVLTGMLDDGAAGLWEILKQGGAAVVQDPDEAAYSSMPESAIRGVSVQYILCLKEIGPLLTRLSVGDRREEQAWRQDSLTQDSLPQDSLTQGSLPQEAQPGLAPPGTPASPQACPECGGVMHMEQLGKLKEYVCHVGHRIGLQTMIVEKTNVVERAMWAALSMSEELVQLLEEAKGDIVPAIPGALPKDLALYRNYITSLRAILGSTLA